MLREAGEIDELSRGVYRRADTEPTAHLDLLAVCTRAPRAVVCGESALNLRELIDDIPREVHIAVPRGSHRPSATRPRKSLSTPPAPSTSRLSASRWRPASQFRSSGLQPAPGGRRRHAPGPSGRGSLALSALNRYLRRTGQQGVADRTKRQLLARASIT